MADAKKCDRCGKFWEISEYANNSKSYRRKDLCKKCRDDFNKFMKKDSGVIEWKDEFEDFPDEEGEYLIKTKTDRERYWVTEFVIDGDEGWFDGVDADNIVAWAKLD